MKFILENEDINKVKFITENEDIIILLNKMIKIRIKMIMKEVI